jgi:hypothetical protein
MEGYGIKIIAQELKKWNITLTEVLHDHDSSAFLNIRSVFADVIEQICLGKQYYCHIVTILKVMVVSPLGKKWKNWARSILKLD